MFTCKTSGSKTTGKTTLGGNSNVNKPVVNTPNPKTSICATNDDGIFTCKPKNKRDVKKIKRDVQSNYNDAKNKAANAFK
jgi:phosphatidate phosphatase APP1